MRTALAIPFEHRKSLKGRRYKRYKDASWRLWAGFKWYTEQMHGWGRHPEVFVDCPAPACQKARELLSELGYVCQD